MAKKEVVIRTRRANGEGSIYQKKDGHWIGMISLGYDENGKLKRKAVYGNTRTAVVKKLAELTRKISNENYDFINNSDLGTMMHEWLLIFKKNIVTGRTFENTMRSFNLYIKPYIGNMKLDEINHITIQKLFNDMLDKNYSLSYTKKVKFALNQFFDYCVENNLMNSNPVLKTKIKSRDRKIYDSENKYKAIPLEIREKFLNALNHHDLLKPLCMTMMFAGLRTGEALALTWDNVNFNNKTINVEKGIRQEIKFDENGVAIAKRTVISETKTIGSVREVPMPDILSDALEKYKKRQWAVGRTSGVDLLAQKMFVFANDNGTVRTYSGTKKIFSTFLKRYDLDNYNIHFHTLRHTYSNMLFEAGENPKVVQALLGHRSVKTTITTYNSVDKSYFKNAINIFNNTFKVDENILVKPQKTILDDLSLNDLTELIKLLDQKKKELAEKDKSDFEI